ncbi:MAG TPA: hypothetical protein ENI13_00630 [candidate division CPR3 bacterium]|uniref:Uncharacterized protein n=1 Tax=candidate division CPR3 bacterium TaxID=2268181 RepID=A0A7C1NZD5_UNCC3|nr:hypothetical protein [candidate division CPR3 bacterium]
MPAQYTGQFRDPLPGQPGYNTLSGTPTFDSARFQAGFDAAKAAGTQAPTTVGGAAQVLGQFTPQVEEPDQIQSFLAADPFLNELTLSFQNYMSEQNQRASLVEEYQALLESSGIEALDTELLDMKQVIEGSEDDIRAEISSAGGFSTESQVLALTNSRNKQLIKNYNALLETRNTKEKYLDTMLSLTIADRQEANQQFDTMMNFNFRIADLQQRMQNNAIAGIERMVNTIGWNGIVDSLESPYELGLLERTYGLPQGGATIAAQRESETLAFGQEERQFERREAELDISLKQAQIANIQSQISEREKAEEEVTGDLGISPEAEMVLRNPGLLENFTPTERGKLLTEIARAGGMAQTVGQESALTVMNTALGTIDTLRDVKGFLFRTGVGQATGLTRFSLFNLLPGSAARQAEAYLTTLKGQLTLPNLEFMRGLGRMSQEQFRVLKDASVTLDLKALSDDAFYMELDRVEETLRDIVREAEGRGVMSIPTDDDYLKYLEAIGQ